MSVLCPICHQPINLETNTCASGEHTYDIENRVLILADEALRQQIAKIDQHRAEIWGSSPPITDYNALPFSLADQHFEWRFRAEDAAVVAKLLNVSKSAADAKTVGSAYMSPAAQRVRYMQSSDDHDTLRDHTRTTQIASPIRIPKSKGQVLEIGAWNGWLTHHIARAGYDVIAADYSAHPSDGLGAKQYYSVDWLAIQMDLSDLSIFDPCFDVVIINHGLHLFPDPVSYVEQARTRLKPGGKLILLNLTFFRDPSQRKAQFTTVSETFQQKYGVPMLLKPSRGYMDFDDKAKLEAAGIKLHTYSGRRKANLKASLIKTAPAYFYGTAQA